MRVLAFAGSLKKASYNRALIEAARQLAPSSMTIEKFELDDIPLQTRGHIARRPKSYVG
jgi:chromate reductase